MEVEVGIEGIEQLSSNLLKMAKALPVSRQNAILRKAGTPIAREARKIIRGEFKSHINPKTGQVRTLARAIKTFNAKKGFQKGQEGLVIVKPRRGKEQKYDAWYARFLEYGTQKGIRARHFMLRAYQSRIGEARKIIEEEIPKEFDKVPINKLR